MIEVNNGYFLKVQRYVNALLKSRLQWKNNLRLFQGTKMLNYLHPDNHGNQDFLQNYLQKDIEFLIATPQALQGATYIIFNLIVGKHISGTRHTVKFWDVKSS